MKYRCVYILLVAFFLFSKPAVYAAYRAKKTVAVASASETSSGKIALESGIGSLLQHSNIHRSWPGYFGQRESPKEWVSVVAFASGILGLFLPGLNFAAILFGILGLRKGTRLKGFAVSGLVLGIVELFLFIFFEVVFISLIF